MFVWQSFMSASFFPFKALQLLIVCMCFNRVDSYFSILWMCCGSVELSSHILCVPFDGWTINFTLPILFVNVCVCVCVIFKFSPFVSVRFSFRFIQFFLNIKHCQYWCNTVYLILAVAPIRILDVSVQKCVIKWKIDRRRKKTHTVVHIWNNTIVGIQALWAVSLWIWIFICANLYAFRFEQHNFTAVLTLSCICNPERIFIWP